MTRTEKWRLTGVLVSGFVLAVAIRACEKAGVLRVATILPVVDAHAANIAWYQRLRGA